MRKSKNLSHLLLGTKLILIVCFLLINQIVVCSAKSSNNKDEGEITHTREISTWGSVVLSEKWEKENTTGDTVLFVLNDHSSSLKFYPLHKTTTSDGMKSYLIEKAVEYMIPTFYRTVGNEQLENVNAKNGGFVQGTASIDDRVGAEEDVLVEDSLATSHEVEEIAENSDPTTSQVRYVVVVGLQGAKGVFILEATTTELEEVPMSISRAQRSWLLR